MMNQDLPKTPATNAMRRACPDFRALKASMAPAATNSGAERTAFTHALYCPTCRVVADEIRASRWPTPD